MRQMTLSILLSGLLITGTPAFGQQVIELSPGDSLGSTSDEVKAVSEKVRQQIIELNKGILHGSPQFSIVGNVEKVGNSWVINGDSFIINEDTVIHGELKPGAYVEIRGNLEQGKPKVAKQVLVGNETTTQLINKKNESSDSKKSAVDFNWNDRR